MIGVQPFGELDVPWIPAIPLSRLVATDQHDNVPIGVEGEQHSLAAINPRLLELAHAGSVDDVDVRAPLCGAAGDDLSDRAPDLFLALRVQAA
jgi:hypothetical protein